MEVCICGSVYARGKPGKTLPLINTDDRGSEEIAKIAGILKPRPILTAEARRHGEERRAGISKIKNMRPEIQLEPPVTVLADKRVDGYWWCSC